MELIDFLDRLDEEYEIQPTKQEVASIITAANESEVLCKNDELVDYDELVKYVGRSLKNSQSDEGGN